MVPTTREVVAFWRADAIRRDRRLRIIDEDLRDELMGISVETTREAERAGAVVPYCSKKAHRAAALRGEPSRHPPFFEQWGRGQGNPGERRIKPATLPAAEP